MSVIHCDAQQGAGQPGFLHGVDTDPLSTAPSCAQPRLPWRVRMGAWCILQQLVVLVLGLEAEGCSARAGQEGRALGCRGEVPCAHAVMQHNQDKWRLPGCSLALMAHPAYLC